ncbi:MAG: protein translocase subunit SecD [Candidatus Babeliales bacterium]
MNISLKKMAFSGLGLWIAGLALSLYFLLPLREKLRFGIDLVGGTYITLEVQTEKAVEAELHDRLEQVHAKLKETKNAAPKTADFQGNSLILTFDSAAHVQAASNVLRSPDITLTTSGNDIVIKFTESKIKRIKEDAVLRNIEVLRTRLDKLSVAEISIASHGEKNIVVELPDVSDPQQAKAMIGTAAVLEFKIVEKEGSTPDDILYEYDGELPAGMEILPGKESGDYKRYYLVSKRAALSGKYLKDAHPQFDSQHGQMVVAFTLTPEGGHKFYELTSRNYQRTLAVELDGVIITAAVIQASIRDHGQISGSFTPEQARELSVLLKSGSFVAPVTFEEERQVGPSLGHESVRQGMLSCLVGLALLFLFSVIVYKVCGIFAFITLICNLILILLGMAWLKATLTLPGIAGIVLTVGMAIDASILIFESIRDDIKSGMPIKKAVDAGFADALRVILDSNITTFIVGAVLYKFGTGPIQGFAVTMMLGIISTLVTGLFFLKSIFNFMLSNFNIQKLRI